MKVVILAAGRGVRMGELTKNSPKPLLTVLGKSLLEHKLDLLPNSVDEIIIIINYLGSLVQKHIGNNYKGIPVTYVKSELKGTAYALFDAREYLKNSSFMVMAGDDIYHKDDLKDISESDDWVIHVSNIKKKQ